MRLLNRHKVLILRNALKGHYDLNGDWVDNSEPIEMHVIGNVQPYLKSNTQVKLPDGIREDDVRIFYTRAVLQTANKKNGTMADKMVYKGTHYEAFTVFDWGGQGRLEHHAVVFIKEDKMNETV